MSNNFFNYYPSKGLDIICPDPLYKGSFTTLDEYNNIIQDDTRAQPEQSDLTSASINLLKQEISDFILNNTYSIIYYGFSFSLFPNVKIQSTPLQQNTLLSIFLLKDTTCVVYPFNLNVSEDATNNIISITINNKNELELLFKEFYEYKNNVLYEESIIKNNISNLSLNELLSFNDTRLIPTQY